MVSLDWGDDLGEMDFGQERKELRAKYLKESKS